MLLMISKNRKILKLVFEELNIGRDTSLRSNLSHSKTRVQHIFLQQTVANQVPIYLNRVSLMAFDGTMLFGVVK